jgi:ATP-dependent Clp protease ATP-binding subunit ClpA
MRAVLKKIFWYAPLALWILLWGGAAFMFAVILLDKNAGLYSLFELFFLDHRIPGFILAGCVLVCFLLYQRGRKEEGLAYVEQFRYGSENERLIKRSVATWLEARTVPLHERIRISATFTPEARRSIDLAYAKALELHATTVILPHVLFGLFKLPSIESLFLRLGFLAERLSKQIFHDPVSSAPTPDPDYGDDVMQALFQAYEKAYAAHQKYVGAAELLLAVVEQAPQIQDWFFDMGIDMPTLTNAVEWVRVRERMSRAHEALSRAAGFRPTNGMDRAMTALATPLLDQYSQDLTLMAQFGHTEMCVARDKEMEEMLRILESGDHNLLLVADHGIGKKTLIDGLADRMVQNDVPRALRDKRFVRLNTSALIAGTTAAGAVERLIALLTEIARARNIVLCINNIHELVGISAGAGGQSLDVAAALTEYLGRVRFLTIATTTPDAFSQVILNTGLANVFSNVTIREMDDNQAIQVLESKTPLIEYRQQVFYSYHALAKAVELARRFLHETYLPGNALELITEAASAVRRTKGKSALVSAEDVAAVVVEKTKIPVNAVSGDESSKLLRLEEELHKRVIGQNEAVSLVANALRRARAAIRAKNRPIANFLFLGPTGVGKTELTKTIADVYFGGENRMIRLDMSEYQDTSSVYRLIGAPGEKGTGILTEAVRRAPFSLILLDELEKADKNVLNVFLQVMDDGRLTDSTGRVMDFTNTIIIATSNAGTSFVSDRLKEGLSTDAIKDRLIHGELRTYFRPEFLNRFDGIVLFKPLEQNHIEQIARLMLARVVKDLEEKGVNFVLTDEGLAYIASVGFDPEFGARPLRRAIEEHVENKLAELVLSGSLPRRSTVVLEAGGRISVY